MLNALKVAWAENGGVLRNFFSLSVVEFADYLGVPLKHVGVALAALTVEVQVTVTTFVALRKYGLDVFARSNKDAYNLEPIP